MRGRLPRLGTWQGWLLLVAGVATIAYARPRAAEGRARAGRGADVFALPAPGVLATLSLGHRAALADWLFTSTLVTYGAHGEERRRFEHVGRYLDAITGVDPRFCQAYRYADTFIIYQPTGNPTPDDVRHVRRLLEKGLTMCPADEHLWLSAGQFMAFIGPQFLTDDAEKQDFRRAAAPVLARASVLASGSNPNVQWQALAAAGIFTKEGQAAAAVAFLERAYAVSDDEELKASISRKLALLDEERRIGEARRHEAIFDELWQNDLPFLSRTGVLVMGPPPEPFRRAGLRRALAGFVGWTEWFREKEGERPASDR